MKGILNINKPENMTSFDAVAILRKVLGEKKIGHMGTLDPMATGVLPITIGRATRVLDYLDCNLKEYVGEFTFGLKTDTDDIWGEVTERASKDKIEKVTADAVKKELESFKGVIDQIPPSYSAIKVDGKKLYQYARSGDSVEIDPRRVYVESIDLMNFFQDDEGNKRGLFRIRCSKGTYIRSIARDLGEALGTGATMSGLVRTRNGVFGLENSIEMEKARNMSKEELLELMVPLDKVLEHFPKVTLGDWESRLFLNGTRLWENQWKTFKENREEIESYPLELPEMYKRAYRVYGINRNGKSAFLGVGIKNDAGELKADKVFE